MQFPLKHISVRVPWHDTAWTGCLCQDPEQNTACTKLRGIAEKKGDTCRPELAGKDFSTLKFADWPCCATERVGFMSAQSYTRKHKHAYADTSPKTHGHLKETDVFYPAYSAAAIPFRWMLKSSFVTDAYRPGLSELYPLEEVNENQEPNLGFNTAWWQHKNNQSRLLETFWAHVKPEDSLVFFYAKQISLVEDNGRRILIGVGRVNKYSDLTEYSYKDPKNIPLPCMLWERLVSHSIRPNGKDGFLLPYHALQQKMTDDESLDPSAAIAYAPEDYFTEFSYATEHVGNDAAISSLLACHKALKAAETLLDVSFTTEQEWIDREVGRLWEKRGPFPGMGNVLRAMGIRLGNFVAAALHEKMRDSESPWDVFERALKKPQDVLPAELAKLLTPDDADIWQNMTAERKAFLHLLSRMDLSPQQAVGLVDKVNRQKISGLDITDGDFIKNPYLFYEILRLTPISMGISAVDRGVFPAPTVAKKFPLPAPSAVQSASDGRRLRALIIAQLEQAALLGDTLSMRERVLQAIQASKDPITHADSLITLDHLTLAENKYFGDAIEVVSLGDGNEDHGYQLQRLTETQQLISNVVCSRIKPSAKRHALDVNWRALLDAALPSMPKDSFEFQRQEQARKEKTAALEEMCAARFSVLVGGAGTGKTTLLSVFCSQEDIKKGGVLLLTPTGKSRVRLQEELRKAGVDGLTVYTIAQFLVQKGRFNPVTQQYRLTHQEGQPGYKTIIVDESSMLTEEMLAALLESVTTYHRLILVGDPRQLPPIGAGRPFADIIAHVRPEDIEYTFPRVAKSYAELRIPNRQEGRERDDLTLASLFGGDLADVGSDEAFEIVNGNKRSDTVRFVRWDTGEELRSVLPDVLEKELGLSQAEDKGLAFDAIFGAEEFGPSGVPWFGYTTDSREGSGLLAEQWQILTPTKQAVAWGTTNLNDFIHKKYRAHALALAHVEKPWERSVLPPQGNEQIVYGDKVINTRNRKLKEERVYPKQTSPYLANGEIGVVIGFRKNKRRNFIPNRLEIEFSTQPGFSFSFYPSDFSEEKDANIELAYALTVHKAQGSQFKTVFFVLPRNSLQINRELIYTALTRQQRNVVVLHQGGVEEIHKFSSEIYSSTANRITNLFSAPAIVEVKNTTPTEKNAFLESKLIHKTDYGDAVRSKSELVIANKLYAAKISYRYEQPLVLGGITKYPDFTIEDDATGITWYWEHLGMLSDVLYKTRWEKKLAWYKSHGILPLEEGHGAKGTLIITQDDCSGGLNSQKIDSMVKILRQ